MRIDKWLWAARLFRTRTLAAEAIDLGRVRVNGERIKPARAARVGDRVEILRREARRELVIRAIGMQRGPSTIAQSLYEESAGSLARRERGRDQRPYDTEPAHSIKGRPTKREGRMLRSVRQVDNEGD